VREREGGREGKREFLLCVWGLGFSFRQTADKGGRFRDRFSFEV